MNGFRGGVRGEGDGATAATSAPGLSPEIAACVPPRRDCKLINN